MTELVFSAAETLGNCQFLARPDFDLNETMSAYEAMDAKMDMRLARHQAPNPRSLIKSGTLITDRPLTQ